MREPVEHPVQAAKSGPGLPGGTGPESQAKIPLGDLSQVRASAEPSILRRSIDPPKEPVIE